MRINLIYQNLKEVKIMKIRKIAYLSTLFAFLLPALVVATVVISYTYPITSTPQTATIYLTTGPNYNAASAMGLITPGLSGIITSGTSIAINTVSGSYETALVNVLEVYNGTSSVKYPVYVTLYAPSISGLTMYASTSPLNVTNSTSGISISGTPVSTSGTTFQLTASGAALYIGFLMTGSASGSANFVINYQINSS
jgi:hypothetical protein